MAPGTAVVSRAQPAAGALCEPHHTAVLLLAPVFAHGEALDGQRPRRAPDTANVGVELALDVPLGWQFPSELTEPRLASNPGRQSHAHDGAFGWQQPPEEHAHTTIIMTTK